MAEVITSFKLETTQYDSKLREAAKELSEFAKDAAKAGNEFQKFTAGNVEAARAFGNIGTSATNAKDKVKELVGAYNDMARAYNALTVEQQKSDFGKAMSDSMQNLKVRIREAKQEMQGLASTKMPDVGEGGLFGGKMDGMLSVLGGNLMTKGVMMAASAVTSFVGEIQDAVKQGIELAKQGEGIRIAFERIGNGQILDGLREATHGTVTDIELMKAAVKFSDFKLPVEELGTMLAFAQQKAKDTGQSVDYMVDSIVTGLGRKSLMILDNLGLSAAEVKDKMKETGDMTKAVGAIIREQMAKAGDYVETAADRATAANVELTNAMTRLGETFQPLSDTAASVWTSIKVGALDLLNSAIKPLIDSLTEAGRLRREVEKINATTGTGQTHSQKTLGMLSNYRGNRQELYNRQLGLYQQAEAEAWRKANEARQKYNAELERDRKRNRTANSLGTTAPNMALTGYENAMQKAEARAKALQKIRKEYEEGAKAILNPQPQTPAPSSSTTGTKKTGGGRTTKVTVADVAPEGSMKALQKQVQDLRKAQELATDPNRWREYQKSIDAVTDSIAVMRGELPKDKEVTFTVTAEASEAMEVLRDVEGVRIDDKSMTVTAETSEALRRVQELIGDIDGTVVTIHAQVVDEELARLEAPVEVSAEANADIRTDFEKLQDSIRIKISDQNIEVDNNTLGTLMQVAMENGISDMDLDFSNVLRQMMEGADIPESSWETLVEEINERLAELGVDPIKIDYETGGVDKLKKDSDAATKAMQSAASAASSIGSALQQIEDPGAKVLGIIAQAIASVAQGFAGALASPATTSEGIWAWIAAAAAGTATMISTIASIKSATSGNFASGGIVPGNSYSGDNMRTSDYGINSGELILNRAQQDSIASQIQDGGMQNLRLSATVTGEQIRLVLNNTGKRQGMGEYLTFK